MPTRSVKNIHLGVKDSPSIWKLPALDLSALILQSLFSGYPVFVALTGKRPKLFFCTAHPSSAARIALPQ